MKRRFYVRSAIDYPYYLQDYTTFILVGRNTRLFNTRSGDWFVVSDAFLPNRAGCFIKRISARQWLGATGWRGFLELMEDFTHVRLTWLKRNRYPSSELPLEPPRVSGGGYER